MVKPRSVLVGRRCMNVFLFVFLFLLSCSSCSSGRGQKDGSPGNDSGAGDAHIGSDADSDSDGDMDGDSDTDVDTDTDGDTDTDTDTDSDGDSDGGCTGWCPPPGCERLYNYQISPGQTVRSSWSDKYVTWVDNNEWCRIRSCGLQRRDQCG